MKKAVSRRLLLGIASLTLRNTMKKAVSRRLFFQGISLFIFKVQKRLCRFLNPLQRYCFFIIHTRVIYMLCNTFLPKMAEMCCRTYVFKTLGYLLSNSMTSKSRISVPSITNLSSVCTVCQPCLPAAPGFMVSICHVLSYCTFKI